MSNTWQTYARDFDKYTIGQDLDPDTLSSVEICARA